MLLKSSKGINSIGLLLPVYNVKVCINSAQLVAKLNKEITYFTLIKSLDFQEDGTTLIVIFNLKQLAFRYRPIGLKEHTTRGSNMKHTL